MGIIVKLYVNAKDEPLVHSEFQKRIRKSGLCNLVALRQIMPGESKPYFEVIDSNREVYQTIPVRTFETGKTGEEIDGLIKFIQKYQEENAARK